MANKEGANLKDEEGTVQTAFSVWGSDDESELDKGVGGLDPAHHDINHVNGRNNARERPALITIDNRAASPAAGGSPPAAQGATAGAKNYTLEIS